MPVWVPPAPVTASERYVVDLPNGVDTTGTSPADGYITTAVTAMLAKKNATTSAYDAWLRLPPGALRITNLNVFDALTRATTQQKGLTIGGAYAAGGKRATRIILDPPSPVASTDPRANAFFKLTKNRQFCFRDFEIQTTAPSLVTAWYLWGSAGTDNVYPSPWPTGDAPQNSGLFHNIAIGANGFDRIIALDGNTRFNQNSELHLYNWTMSNQASFSSAGIESGLPLYSAVLIGSSTGTGATGGTAVFGFGGSSSASFAYNASNATVQAALEAMPSIGSGNIIVESPSGGVGQWIVRFIGSLLGTDTSSCTLTLTSWTGSTYRAYRYPPQQSQALNYHVEDCEFEYNGGNLFKFNMGGSIRFTGGKSSYIGGIGGAAATFFTCDPNIPGRANDVKSMSVTGIRYERRNANVMVADVGWGDIAGEATFRDLLCAHTSGDAVNTPVLAFRTSNTGQGRYKVDGGDWPGYFLLDAPGAVSGGDLKIERLRMRGYSAVGLGTVAAGGAAVRATNGGRLYIGETVLGSGGALATEGRVTL